MAEKKKEEKAAVEVTAAAPPAPASKSPGVLKLFLFVAMPMMVFQAALAYFLITRFAGGPDGSVGAAQAKAMDEVIVAGDSTAGGQSGEGRGGHEATGEGEPGKATAARAQMSAPPPETKEESQASYTYYVKDIIINPAATAGTRFLNLSLALEFGRESLGSELEKEDFRVRDSIINILIGKRIDEIDGVADKERLRLEIRDAVNSLLRSGRVRKVYFINFVLQ